MEKHIEEVDRLISDLKFLNLLETRLRKDLLELETVQNGQEVLLRPSERLLNKIKSEVSSLKLAHKVDLENRIKK